LLDCTFAFLVK